MFHRQEIAVNKATGVPVPGVIVRLYDADSNPVSLYSDTNGTPIITVSGIANAAVADQAGNYSYYVNDGLYTERLYIGDAEFFAIPDLVCQGLVALDLASTDTGKGAALVVHKPDATGAVGRTVAKVIDDGGLNVMEFGAGVGQGTAAVDTAAWQAALNALASTGQKRLIVPFGQYLINATLVVPANLNCVEIVGQGGYDGVRGPINLGLYTSLKWVGASNAATPVVKFDQATGCVWRGISINCNYTAGYGIQFMSSSLTNGGVKNVVERCSIHYALRDGIIVGEWGDPAVAPGARQFFGNRFGDLTFYGCGQSGIHINEWNADQQSFDMVMIYLDDAAVPQPALNGIWFDSGGQHSLVQNCQAGGLSVVDGVPSSGFFIRNQKSDSSLGGAFGLEAVNCWQEGAGGFYYGVHSTNDSKAFKFERCASFTNDPTNRSVYIDKGTSAPIPYTFDTCTFLSDVEIASATFHKESLELINCSFAAGKGVIDANGVLSIGGQYSQIGTSGTATPGQFVVPRFADNVRLQLDENLGALYTEGVSKMNDRVVLIVTQDATGGRTIDFVASTNFSAAPDIPQPATAPGAKTVYTFVSDGAVYYLAAVRLYRADPIDDPVGGATVDAEARVAIAGILAVMRGRKDIG